MEGLKSSSETIEPIADKSLYEETKSELMPAQEIVAEMFRKVPEQGPERVAKTPRYENVSNRVNFRNIF